MISKPNIRPSTVIFALVVLAVAVAVGSGTVVGQTANEVDIQDPGAEIVESGSTDLVVTGVDSTEGVGAFEVNVTYNENIDSIQVSDSSRFTVESATRETNGNTTVTIVGYTGETTSSGERSLTLAEIQATSQNYDTTGEIQVDEVSTLVDPEGDDIVPNSTGSGASFTISQSTGGNDGGDDDDDDGGDDDNDDGGNGGTPSDEPEDGAGEGSPTVQQVRDQLNAIEPSTTTQTEITDDDPDTAGTQISPEGAESVQQISFNEEELSGNVDINEYSDPTQDIRSSVSESVSAAGAVDRGDVSTISVADITPDSEAAEDSAATVTFAVPADEVTNPDQLTVIKETFDSEQQEETWTELPTTVEETGNEEITVSAQAESFSLFAVAEIEQTDDQQQVEDDAADDDPEEPTDDGAEEPTDDGGPGPAAIIGVLVLIAAAGAAVYVFSQQGE